MQWENLTAPDFAAAVKETRGVCLLPLPCIEKHGEHLPLGTDLFIGMEIARRAAEIEPAVVFPPFYLTQILEARHQPGTIAIGTHLMLKLLEAVCDEIGIAINKNQVPFDPAPPLKPSGIRVGSPGPCTWGMGPEELNEIGHIIGRASKNIEDAEVKKELGERVLSMVGSFPAYPDLT